MKKTKTNSKKKNPPPELATHLMLHLHTFYFI